MAALPERYVCTACGVCAATSEGLLEAREDVLAFGQLRVPEDAQGSKTIACPWCEQALGSKGSGVFLLRQDRVARRPEPLEILVFSLKKQEIAEATPALEEAFPHCNVSSRVVVKADLRGMSLAGLRPIPDIVVIVHRNEGRVLLTDRNGFYHDALGAAWQLTRGNVLVVLTRTQIKAEAELFDAQLLHSLSAQGDQPTIGALSAAGRVLTWDSAPSHAQRQQLRSLAARAYFREPPPAVPGLPAEWACRRPGAGKAQSWCSLL